MKKRLKDHLRKNRLSYTVLGYLLLCSVIFTLLTSTVQIYREYRQDIRKIDEVMTLIHESYLESLSTSLWSFDFVQMKAQANGILTLPLIKRVTILERFGGKEKNVLSQGTIQDRVYLERSFPLKFIDDNVQKNIGTLVVYAGMDEIRAQIGSKIVSTLFMKIFEIIILSCFMLLVFRHTIMKHLEMIERFFSVAEVERLDKKLVLDRRRGRMPDILDAIVQAINAITSRLFRELNQLKETESRLTRTNQELVRNRKILEDQERIRAAQVDINEILRDDQNIRELADRLTAFLCRRFNAGVGVFYHVDKQSNMVIAVGSFACRLADLENTAFAIGEGQVGQVVKNKEMLLRNVNVAGHMTIGSSLGQAPPRQVLIYPFLRENHVSAVLEMGSFDPISPETVQLLRQIAESVAMAADSAVVRTQTLQLDREIQEKSKALEDRDWNLAERDRVFRIVFDQSDRFLVLTDPQGNIRDVNKTFLTFLGKGLSDVQSKELWEAGWWADKGRVKALFSRHWVEAADGNTWQEVLAVHGGKDEGIDTIWEFTPVGDRSDHNYGLLVVGRIMEGKHPDTGDQRDSR